MDFLTQEENRAYNLYSDLETFLQNKPERKTIKKRLRIIYFLILHDKVVYVGKSNAGITRPFSHTNKTFDSISYYEVPEEINLDIIEYYYINKFKPHYNKSFPLKSSVFNIAIKELNSSIY